MKMLFLGFFYIALLIQQEPNSYQQPDRVFKYSEEMDSVHNHLSNKSESFRKLVIDTLKDSQRDTLLEKIVDYCIIDNEKWFDLRGIEIRQGEIDGNTNLSRICWDFSRFEGVDLRAAQLSDGLFRNSSFNNVNLQGASIERSQLQGCSFINCSLQEASFQQSYFGHGSCFIQCRLDDARFDNCKTKKGITFSYGTMKNAVFDGAELSYTKFIMVDLSGVSFENTNLSYTDFYDSLINNINLTDSNLAHSRLGNAKLTEPIRLIRSNMFAVYLGDIDISKIDMSYVKWGNKQYYVGEEIDADIMQPANNDCNSINEKCKLYAQAEIIYRTLGEKYHKTGQMDEYLKLRYRALEARRKFLSFDTGRHTWEYYWLNLSMKVDGHGSQARVLLKSFIKLILFFAVVYFSAWTFFRKDWIKWYCTQPDGTDFAVDSSGNARPGEMISPKDMYKTYHGWKKIHGLLQVAMIAVIVSIEATFIFAEKVVGIPNILHLLRSKNERPVAIGIGRIIVGIHASFGAVLFLFAARMLMILNG